MPVLLASAPTSHAVCSWLLPSARCVLTAAKQGDERPCSRCIKRNLADQCQDGARKKAKYLHDAPNEALLPGNANKYKHENGVFPFVFESLERTNKSKGNVVPAEGPPSMPQYSASVPTQRMSLSMQDDIKMQSPISPGFDQQQQASPMNQVHHRNSMSNASPHHMTQPKQQFTPQYMDANDPALFNFDLSSMNFGSNYGALEFGMLGNMGQGIADNGMSPQTAGFPFESAGPYSDGRTTGDYSIDSTGWPTKPVSVNGYDSLGGNFDQWRRNSQGMPHAFAIGTGNSGFSGHSPPSSVEFYGGDFASPTDVNNPAAWRTPKGQQSQLPANAAQRPHSNHQPSKPPESPNMTGQSPNATRSGEPNEDISKKLFVSLKSHPLTKRSKRDPSSIYDNVKAPYPYTLAFHALTAVIGRRFPPKKRVRIAKALASIRPSFISLNRNLTDRDLVFMEQNFQRCIWDYEEDSSACGTPTLIIRRTGEVAYADKEFSVLSGWSHDVLYGHAPNLNVNTGSLDSNAAGSGVATANSSRGGYNTPRGNGIAPGAEGASVGDNAPTSDPSQQSSQAQAQLLQLQQQQQGKRRQPVFLAELLDEDSVVDFYEEYSQRAFGDSRGTTSRRCRLIKYKSPADSAGADDEIAGDNDATNGRGYSKTNGHNGPPSASPAARQQDAPAPGNAATPNSKAVNGHHQDRQRGNSKGPKGGEMTSRRGGRPGISSEEGMRRLGSDQGFVDCMYCWMVKQDCFNIPMLIVINVSYFFPLGLMTVLTDNK